MLRAQANLDAVLNATKAGSISNFAALRQYRGPDVANSVVARAMFGDGGGGLFAIDPSDTTTADDGAMTIVDAAGRRHKRLEVVIFGPRWFGAKGDGVTDDTAAIQAACDYQAARGGGKVDLTGGLWLVDSADLVLDRNVVLSGPWLMPFCGDGPLHIDFTPFSSVILLNPLYTIRGMGKSAGVEGLAVFNKNVFNSPTPTTLRENLDRRNLFAGVGITAGDGTGRVADDFSITNVFVAGFHTGISSNFNARPRWQNISGDNYNGIYITKCYDMDYISNVHFWPSLTPSGGATAYKAYTVVGVTDNGSGECRFELSEDHILQDNDIEIVANGVSGVPGANATFATVKRVDARRFDAPGSVFSGAYVSGGTVHVLVFKRPGIGVLCDTDTDWAQLVTVFCFGYKTGTMVRNSDHAKLFNVGADNYYPVGDKTTTGIWIEGDCSATTLIGCKAAAQGRNFYNNVTPSNGDAVVMTGCDSWGATLYQLVAAAGYTEARGCHFQIFLGNIRVEAAGELSIDGGSLISVAISYATGAKRAEIRGARGHTNRMDLVSSGTSGTRVVQRATMHNSAPAANDGGARVVDVTDSAGAYVEIFRETARATTITAGAVTSEVYWALRSGGTYADRLLFRPGSFGPIINDGMSNGLPTAAWSDLFLASGGVINWNNGVATMTQVGPMVAFNGPVRPGIYIYSTLPTPASVGVGARATISDANAPVWMADAAGGGSTVTPTMSTNVKWVYA